MADLDSLFQGVFLVFSGYDGYYSEFIMSLKTWRSAAIMYVIPYCVLMHITRGNFFTMDNYPLGFLTFSRLPISYISY